VTDPIKIIVGLGNPGPSNLLDRHNAGYWFADVLARRYGGEFRSEVKFHGDLCRVNIEGHDIRLLKPTTYMNRSGLAIQALAAYLKYTASQILVVHDELDLPLGKVKLKRGGGHGGHNGLRDVISHIGKEFFRLRIGIGHPGDKEEVIDYVLRRASREDENIIIDTINDAAGVIPLLLAEGEHKAMHKLHSRDVIPKPYRKDAEEDGEEDKGEEGK